MTVQIDRHIINQILTHALRAPEQEVCGLIGLRPDAPARVYPISNIAEEKNHLFAMDPQQQIDAMRHMRDNGETLFAIYHSHPHAPAAPSALDQQQAAYPEALYLIVSLDTKGVLEMQGYRLQAHQLLPVELELMES